jgi:hypothetical protein
MGSFHQGGWGMYPTLVAGVVLVAVAVRYARNPQAGRNELLRHLSRLTFLIGSLGTVTGTIKSFTSLDDKTPLQYGFIGLGESLNCMGLAMVAMVLAGIIAAVGKAKLKSTAADLADPHTL